MDSGTVPEQEHHICSRCQHDVPLDSRFCPYCGMAIGSDGVVPPVPPSYYQPPPMFYGDRRTTWQKTKHFLAMAGSWLSLLLLVEVAINVAILIWGSTLVLPNTPGSHYPLFLIVPYLITFAEVEGPFFAAYFIMLVVAITASFGWMIYRSVGPFAQELMGRAPEKGPSPAYVISTLFFAVIFINVAYFAVLDLLGVHITTPDFETPPLWKLIVSLASASVWEEIITRVLFIGMPLLAYGLLKRKGGNYRRYFLGGGFELGRPELIFLVFSAAMFGMAHFFNWDVFKVLPTFISGLVLGYLFLRVGLYAAILLHFFVDYLAMPMNVWPGDDVTVMVGLLTLACLVMGLVYLVHYSNRAITFLTGKKIELERPVSVPVAPIYAPPSNYAPETARYPVPPSARMPDRPSFGFVCRNCGNTEARYTDGALFCMHCGKKD
jgi:hypothetical protein